MYYCEDCDEFVGNKDVIEAGDGQIVCPECAEPVGMAEDPDEDEMIEDEEFHLSHARNNEVHEGCLICKWEAEDALAQAREDESSEESEDNDGDEV